MISFEIKEIDKQKVIFINGELFDWGLDEESIEQANKYANDKQTISAIHKDVKNYFIDCISEYLGFKPTIKQINKALEKGFIENDNN
jgi:hypothetical protein